jgi:transketolase
MTSNLRESFAQTMMKIGSKDENLMVMVGDISHGILQPFAQKFPDRYYNIGICEPSIINMAAGLSEVGLIPVVHTIAPFLIERSYEQIKLDFGYQKRGINLISVGSAFDYSQLGCSHHCYTDVSLIGHIENSQVFVPGSVKEFEELFAQSYSDNSVNYFRLTENPHTLDTLDWKIKVGHSILVKQGTDVTIVAVGAQLQSAFDASKVLQREGIEVEILYYPTIKPFDSGAVRKSVLKTRKLITIEELSATDGIFNLCLNSIIGINDLKVKQLAIKGFIHGYGSYLDLCEKAGLTESNIVYEVRNILKVVRDG